MSLFQRVQKLIQRICTADMPDQHSYSSHDIYEAAKAGDTAGVAALLKGNPTLVHSRDQHDDTLLHHAATADIARLLLKSGADVMACGWMGATPLHDAAWEGHADVAVVLIAHGADVNARRSYDGITPLHFAQTAAVAILLLKHGAVVDVEYSPGGTPLNCASARGNADVVRVLLNAGAQVRVISPLGDTPLHGAAKDGHADVVQQLLTAGAVINATDSYDETPIFEAVRLGHTAVVELLIQHGANLLQRNRAGQMPIHRASGREHLAALIARHMPPQVLTDQPITISPAGLPLVLMCCHPSRMEALAVVGPRTLTRWSLEDNTARFHAGLGLPIPGIRNIVLLPDAETIAVVNTDDLTEFRRWHDLQPVDATACPQQIAALAYSPDGHWLGYREGNSGPVYLQDRLTGENIGAAHNNVYVSMMRFDHWSRFLAWESTDQNEGFIRLFRVNPFEDAEAEEAEEWATDDVAELTYFTISPDGRTLALLGEIGEKRKSPDWQGDIGLYTLEPFMRQWMVTIDNRLIADLLVSRHKEATAFSVRRPRLLFVGPELLLYAAQGRVLGFETASGVLVHNITLHDTADVTALALAPDGTIWASLDTGEMTTVFLGG